MFTKQQEDLMLKLYNQGQNAQVICDAVDSKMTTMKRWFNKRGLDFTHIKQSSKFDEKYDLILELYNKGLNCNRIAEKIGEDRRQLAKWLSRRGMDFSHTANKDKLVGREEELVNMFNEGCGSAKIAQKFNVTQEAVQTKLRKMGMRFKQAKYSVNHNFFDEIDSPEKAYLLGLWYSDGWIYNNQIAIGMTDLDMVEKVKNTLAYTGPIDSRVKGGNRKDLHTLSIYSKQLFNSIQIHGCVERKSLVLKWNDKLPSYLYPHFIRGIFDGDGCISWHKSNGQYTVNIVGTIGICDGLQKHFNYGKVYKKTNREHTYVWCVWKRSDIRKFLETIYKDATIYLDRKKEKADDCLARAA